MAIQNTTNLSNAIRTRYGDKYIEAAEMVRLYDKLAAPVGQGGVEEAAWLANTVQVNFLSDMTPGTTTISEAVDVTPSVLRDATATISPTSRWGALQWAEAIDLKAYTDYGEKRFKRIGKNMMETVDLLAQAQALQGGVVHRAAARASLDAGTAGHRLTDTAVSIVDAKLQALRCPPYITPEGRNSWFMILHPFAVHDMRLGGNVITASLYQDKRSVMNFEFGEIGGFKIISSAFAKVFWGAGSANASAIATTLNGAVTALATSIEVASASNIDVGDYFMIGTIETANTHYATNEYCVVTSVSGTTIGVAGEGANGGLRFDHASGETVSNADAVFPVAFGGPMSLAKLYDTGVGEYGQIVGPKRDGILDQFGTLGWKYYGNYGRWVEPWIIRGEFASLLQA